MTSHKDDYVRLADGQTTLPIFFEPWWLDIVCGPGRWDVALYKIDGRLIACMPYFKKSRFGMSMIGNPPFTQYLGVHYVVSKSNAHKRLSEEKKIVAHFLEHVGGAAIFHVAFTTCFKNWLPFYWAGYEQTTKYTYKLSDIGSADDLWARLSGSIRTDVKKARKGYRVVTEGSFEDFIEVLELTYERQGLSMRYPKAILRELFDILPAKSRGKAFFVLDEVDKVCAVAFLVWDSRTAYYILGGADPAHRNDGVASLCLYEAITFASSVSTSFDFDGSMVEGIERFFRAFGAEQVPYYRISKFRYLWLRILYILKQHRDGKL